MGAFLIAVGLEHPFLIQPHLNRTVALHHEAGALGLRTVESGGGIDNFAILSAGKTPRKIQQISRLSIRLNA